MIIQVRKNAQCLNSLLQIMWNPLLHSALYCFFDYKFLEMKLEERRGLKERASSDSDLLKERNMTTANIKDPFPEREFLPFDRKNLVEEYLENLPETSSEFTLPSDSGVGTLSSTTSEYGFDDGEGES